MSSSPEHPPILEEFHGKIIIIIGPMMSGKTTELIRLIDRNKHAKRTVLVIKPLKDIRYSIDQVQTHIKSTGFRDSIDAVSTDDIYNITETHKDGTITVYNPLDYDVIAIDEGNFFNANIVDFAEDMANKGKIVLVSGLNGDINQKHLGYLHLLYPKADKIEHLEGVCVDCGKDAPFTYSDISRKEGEIIVGGSDIYHCICRLCRNIRRAIHK